MKIQLRPREMGNETDMEGEIKTGFTAGIDRNMEALPLRSVHFIQFEIRNIKSVTCLIVHIAQIKLFEETLSRWKMLNYKGVQEDIDKHFNPWCVFICRCHDRKLLQETRNNPCKLLV